eukprot:s47_g62.t1
MSLILLLVALALPFVVMPDPDEQVDDEIEMLGAGFRNPIPAKRDPSAVRSDMGPNDAFPWENELPNETEENMDEEDAKQEEEEVIKEEEEVKQNEEEAKEEEKEVIKGEEKVKKEEEEEDGEMWYDYGFNLHAGYWDGWYPVKEEQDEYPEEEDQNAWDKDEYPEEEAEEHGDTGDDDKDMEIVEVMEDPDDDRPQATAAEEDAQATS